VDLLVRGDILNSTRIQRRDIRVLSDFVSTNAISDVIAVMIYASFIGLSAQVVIHLPFTPVPFTGQTFAVVLGASVLGMSRALYGSILYLFAGLMGVPWFAGGSGGFSVASTPTFGYIVGFLFASALVGYLANRGFDKKIPSTIAQMVIGNVVIYLFGVTYLSYSLNLSLAKAISLGVAPFVLSDLAKVLLAAILLPSAWKFQNWFSSHR
ncbi:unnamed protein product, partial [Acidithrix sp. C25]